MRKEADGNNLESLITGDDVRQEIVTLFDKLTFKNKKVMTLPSELINKCGGERPGCTISKDTVFLDKSKIICVRGKGKYRVSLVCPNGMQGDRRIAITYDLQFALPRPAIDYYSTIKSELILMDSKGKKAKSLDVNYSSLEPENLAFFRDVLTNAVSYSETFRRKPVPSVMS